MTRPAAKRQQTLFRLARDIPYSTEPTWFEDAQAALTEVGIKKTLFRKYAAASLLNLYQDDRDPQTTPRSRGALCRYVREQLPPTIHSPLEGKVTGIVAIPAGHKSIIGISFVSAEMDLEATAAAEALDVTGFSHYSKNIYGHHISLASIPRKRATFENLSLIHDSLESIMPEHITLDQMHTLIRLANTTIVAPTSDQPAS